MISIIVTIDRIEEDYAVCITESYITFSLPISLFGSKPREGSVFDMSLNTLDSVRRNKTGRIQKLFDDLKNNNS